MAALAPVALAALLAGGPSVRPELGVRSELRFAEVEAAGAETASRASLETATGLRVALRWTGVEAGLGWRPRVLVADLEGARRTTLDHAFEARVGSRRDGPTRLALVLRGRKGSYDPLGDAPVALARGAVPTLTTTAVVSFAAVSAGLDVRRALSGRTVLTLRATGDVSTGTDADARRSFPLQRSAGVDLAASRALSRRDGLDVTLGGRTSRTDPNVDARYVATSVLWRRQLGRATSSRLGAGVALTEQEGLTSARPGERTRAPYPVADGGIAHAWEGGTTAELALRLLPALDRLTGELRKAAEATATLRLVPARRWTFALAASGSAFLPDSASWWLRGDARAAWRAAPGVTVELSAYARRQEEPSPLLSFRDFGATAALAFDLQAGLGERRAAPAP